MTGAIADRLRGIPGWLAGAVVGTGAIALLTIAIAAGAYLGYSAYLAVVSLAVAMGSIEASYLASRNWALGQRGPAAFATGAACGGSSLILVSTWTAVTPGGFALAASGVGLLGLAAAAGFLGLYRATGKSTAESMTALVVALALAYFASVLWAAVA